MHHFGDEGHLAEEAFDEKKIADSGFFYKIHLFSHTLYVGAYHSFIHLPFNHLKALK